ncbi:hypothetical protein FNH22_25050 [Fulvivirga sp. M361]|uniref:hypothetical protein n=1 Tax=Fulvivirga sp. M361 TaxID=2594266 RepID=UPI00117BA08B|nr:hypothetical protein [Fulvivirga sp. M361]TRX50923.1 hypothetical protein FNH22_25050 [Fulvivirga sp. M361]
MTFELVSISKFRRQKSLRVLYSICLFLSIALVLGGTYGGMPILSILNAPLSVYITASILGLIFFLLLLDNIFSRKFILGQLAFTEDAIEVNLSEGKEVFMINKIGDLLIKPDHTVNIDAEKTLWRIQFVSNHSKKSFTFLMTFAERKQITVI